VGAGMRRWDEREPFPGQLERARAHLSARPAGGGPSAHVRRGQGPTIPYWFSALVTL
jgi:hypothetical protein